MSRLLLWFLASTLECFSSYQAAFLVLQNVSHIFFVSSYVFFIFVFFIFFVQLFHDRGLVGRDNPGIAPNGKRSQGDNPEGAGLPWIVIPSHSIKLYKEIGPVSEYSTLSLHVPP